MICVGQQLWEIQEGRFGSPVPPDVVSILASELGISTDLPEFEKILRLHSVSYVTFWWWIDMLFVGYILKVMISVIFLWYLIVLKFWWTLVLLNGLTALSVSFTVLLHAFFIATSYIWSLITVS